MDGDPGQAVRDEPLPGFGHRVYTGADPRFELLLAEVARLDADLVIDLALAALILAAVLDRDGGEVIFMLARTVGLAAHAMEEYPHGLRLRPRALASHAEAG
jgi:citrate synthase